MNQKPHACVDAACTRWYARTTASTRRDRSRRPSHEGVLGFSSLAGLLARVSSAGERLPTSSSLAVALLPFDVDPYSGGAAPELHRVPFLDSAVREDATAKYQAWFVRAFYVENPDRVKLRRVSWPEIGRPR